MWEVHDLAFRSIMCVHLSALLVASTERTMMPAREEGIMAAKKVVTRPLRLVWQVLKRVLQYWFQKAISYMLYQHTVHAHKVPKSRNNFIFYFGKLRALDFNPIQEPGFRTQCFIWNERTVQLQTFSKLFSAISCLIKLN